MPPTMRDDETWAAASSELIVDEMEPSMWCFEPRRWSNNFQDEDDSSWTTSSSNNDDGDDDDNNDLRLEDDENDSRDDGEERKQVSFSTVEIREYDITHGDHPCCGDGLAISLDWTYNPVTRIVRVNDRPRSHGEVRKMSYVERKLRLSEPMLEEQDQPGHRRSMDMDEIISILPTKKLEWNISWESVALLPDDLDEDIPPPPDLEPLSFMSQAA